MSMFHVYVWAVVFGFETSEFNNEETIFHDRSAHLISQVAFQKADFSKLCSLRAKYF